MKKYLILVFIFTVSIGFLFCQSNNIKLIYQSTKKEKATKINKTKIYKLKKYTKNSDFNYSKLRNIYDNINGNVNYENVLKVFEPIKGKYNYYQFIATFNGKAYNADGEPIQIKTFHDILIVKTNNKNTIIDAYQYTLEWGELPLQYDLYKTSVKNLQLTNNMNISSLKLEGTEQYNQYNKFLKEKGIIRLR